MARDRSTPSQREIEERISRVGRYSRLVRLGLGIILSAFLLAVGGVLPANLDSVAQAIESILMPLTFAGLGLILYGIGMHLHLMHLNLVRQLQPDEDA
jgi:tellurite resistance protein TehA-like permease